MNLKMINRKRLFDHDSVLYGTIAALAAVVFCMIYGTRILNPTYVDWLLSGGDLSEHYIGWKAYRSSGWMFPIGMTDRLVYPDQVSIIFTDSIPIFSVFFKLLSPLLPTEFQFFGFWGILCFILQGCLSARVIRHFTDHQWAIVSTSILFMVTSVMIWRMYAHTSLAGQWLLILALEPVLVYRKYSQNKNIYKMACILGVLAVSIHIYFVLMCGIILVAFCLEDLLMHKRIKRSVWVLCIYLVSVALTVAVLGGFSSNVDAAGGGLGHYSANLNALFNPQGWSCILKDLATYTGGQYEGFAYLGAGCILLLLLAAAFGWNTLHGKEWMLQHWKQIVTIVVLIFLAAMTALSPVISFGEHLVCELRFPEFIIKIWSIFRATGRVAWIIVYVLMFGAVIALTKFMNRKAFAAVIAVGMLLQIYDIHGTLEAKAQSFHTEAVYESPLKTDYFWNQIAEKKEIKHLVFVNPMSNDEYFMFGNWAFSNHKTVNTFYLARSSQEVVQRNLTKALEELPADHLFVFQASNQLGCLAYDLHYYLVDGFIIGSREPLEGFVPMHPSEFRNVWTFGENRYLENGEDTQDGRMVNPGGRSYGPFWKVPAGNYIVTIEGEQLLDQADVVVFSEGGTVQHEYSILESSSDALVLALTLTGNGVDNLEISIWNHAKEQMKLKSITIEAAE